MKEKKENKFLFLMFEGIGSTIFNSQVAVHVNEMKKNNIKMDVLTFETWNKQWKNSKENLNTYRNKFPNSNIKLKKGVNIYIPFFNLFNVIIFIYNIFSVKDEYSMIHARSDYATFIAIITKPIHKLPVIWDCRGDSVDELRFSLQKRNFFIRSAGFLYLVPSLLMRLFVINKFADKAIFVSNALKEHYSKRLKTFNHVVIPCPVSDNNFYFDEKLRYEKRGELNFDENNKVFLYSGTMAGYQFVDGLIQLFEKILEIPNNVVLILTSEPDKARKIFFSLLTQKLIILKVPFTEMVDFYNAADFAILIREKRNLNYVASPTKFGEYCLTGLPVIMNKSIDQSYKIAIELGNYISYENVPIKEYPVNKRVDIARQALKFFSRSESNALYFEFYR